MKNVPNILSSIRIVLAPIFLYLFLQDQLFLQLISIVIFTIAAITDYFDGHIARKHEIESQIGIFLDPLADKVLTFSAFIVLPFIDESQFPWWAVTAIIVRDVTITLLRIYSKKKNITIKTRMTAKAKTTVQMVFLYIGLLVGAFAQKGFLLSTYADWVLQSGILFILMLFVTGLTVFSGLEYIYVNRALFSKARTS